LEHESHHHHHPHGTGLRWLDISLGVAAGIVSLVSLWLGLHSAHSMEKLVAANSYPYLDLGRSTHIIPKDGAQSELRRKIEYEFLNGGIGPARIEWVEFTYKGKPVHNLKELIGACCSTAEGKGNGFHARGNVQNSLVRPGGSLVMMSWSEPATPNPLFDALHRSMDDMDFSACYCSVFDECYIRKNDASKPQPVEQCTPPAVPFQPSFQQN
jgi:hypothetical protein